MILDRFDDNNEYLGKLSSDLSGLKLVEKFASQHEGDFGGVVVDDAKLKYKYPLHTGDEAVASAVYFKEYGYQIESPSLKQKIASNINTALKNYGLSEFSIEVEKLASTTLGYTTAENELFEDDNEFSFSLESLFGLDKPNDELELVEDAFASCSARGKRRLVFKVKEASLQVPDKYKVYDGDSVGSDFAFYMKSRMLISDDATKEKLSSLLRGNKDDPDELVSELELIDKANNFWCWYGSRFPDPVATVYGNSLEKIAAQKVRRVELDDASYSESDFVVLLEHAKEKIASVYGEEVFDKILESPIERYSALPSHHRNAVKRLLLSA